ncbi:MAG: hypothetical protein ACREWE_02030 [Gammaproteobacteria bacterium]
MSRKKGDARDMPGFMKLPRRHVQWLLKTSCRGKAIGNLLVAMTRATKAFVESGKVKKHAETTAKISPEEERELEEAEKAGKERAKEEDRRCGETTLSQNSYI